MTDKVKRVWKVIKRIIDFTLYVIIGVIVFLVLIQLFQNPGRPQNPSCSSNLKQLGIALYMYAQDYEGYFPDSYESFTNLYSKYASSQVFWCPSDVNNKKVPKTIDNWEIDGENSSRISYEYILGLSKNDVDAVIVRDNTPTNHDGKGVWALFVDGHVDWIPVESEEK